MTSTHGTCFSWPEHSKIYIHLHLSYACMHKVKITLICSLDAGYVFLVTTLITLFMF